MYNYIYKNKRVFLPVFAKNVQYYRKNVEYIKKRITFQHIYIHNNFLLNKYLSIHWEAAILYSLQILFGYEYIIWQ